MKLSLKIKTAVMAGVLALAGAGLALAPVSAVDPGSQILNGANATNLNTGNTANLNTVVKRVINTVLYIIGILAVIMIIVGGIQYTTSGGDQAAVTKAKNTILYGIVGLIIAVLAYAIVNFVITNLRS